MKKYIDKLKEIETLVELSIGTTMTDDKAADIYAITNDLMCMVKKDHKSKSWYCTECSSNEYSSSVSESDINSGKLMCSNCGNDEFVLK